MVVGWRVPSGASDPARDDLLDEPLAIGLADAVWARRAVGATFDPASQRKPTAVRDEFRGPSDEGIVGAGMHPNVDAHGEVPLRTRGKIHDAEGAVARERFWRTSFSPAFVGVPDDMRRDGLRRDRVDPPPLLGSQVRIGPYFCFGSSSAVQSRRRLPAFLPTGARANMPESTGRLASTQRRIQARAVRTACETSETRPTPGPSPRASRP